MGWSGRAPAPPAGEAGKGRQRRGARHVTQARCCNRRDRYRYRQELVSRRGSRLAWRDRPTPEVVSRPSRNTARQPAALSHWHGGLRRCTPSEPQTHIAWPRRSVDASQICAPLLEGAEERLPRCRGDRRGGAAPEMKFVATKTAEQLDLQALHRVRERLVSQRTGIINQIRAFLLERGVAVRQGLRFLRAELPRILATPCDVLSPRMVRVIEDLAGDWRRLDERIEGLSSEIEVLARRDVSCERLMSVPGIGPIISSAMVAAIGAGDAFSKGRDLLL